MNATTLNPLLLALVQTPTIAETEFSARLAATLTRTNENSFWTFYSFQPSPPFASGEIRLHQSGDKALVVLECLSDSGLALSDLDLEPFGQLRGIDANPRIPPEGADAYIYELNGVQVSFQFWHHSKKLRLIALEWKGQPAGE